MRRAARVLRLSTLYKGLRFTPPRVLKKSGATIDSTGGVRDHCRWPSLDGRPLRTRFFNLGIVHDVTEGLQR